MSGNLDREVMIGNIRLPRWIAGRDAYDSDLDPGDGFLVHNSEPRFVARWRIGEPPLSGLTYTDSSNAGEDDEDNLSLYDFVWTDEPPGADDFRALMAAAIEALDHFVSLLCEAYE